MVRLSILRPARCNATQFNIPIWLDYQYKPAGEQVTSQIYIPIWLDYQLLTR